MCDDCGRKKCTCHRDIKTTIRYILIGLGALILIVLITIFLVWIILRPSKPMYALQDATIYALNLSGPNFLTTSMQVSISTRNPNDKIGIYYEKIDVYASYHNQQITLATELPPHTYLGHEDIIVWSPPLCGNDVPVSPYLATALAQDLNVREVLMHIRVEARLKWKVGTWMSGKYRLNVNCPAYFNFADWINGAGNWFGIKCQFAQGCSVEVSG